MNDKEIGRKILLNFGKRLGNSTVQTLWKKYQETNRISNNRSKEGRARLMDQDDQAMLIDIAKENRLSSVKSLKNDLNLSPNRETVNRELLEKGYKAYKAPMKPLLTQDNILQRYEFAFKHQHCGTISGEGSPFQTKMYCDWSARMEGFL